MVLVASPTADAQDSAPPPIATFPFDLYSGHLYIRATVNGDSAWLLLDTGARTTLDRQWALAVGALPIPKRCRAECNGAVVDSIRIAGVRLENYEVGLTSFALVSAAGGRHIRGLLGRDLLRYFTIELDPRARLVKLYDPRTYEFSGRGVEARMLVSQGGYLLVQATLGVEGASVPMQLILDTGASRHCLILDQDIAQRHPRFAAVPGVPAVVGVGLRGPLFGRVIRIKDLRVGRYKALRPTAGLPDSASRQSIEIPFDGLLGNRLLVYSGAVFDYARRRVIFRESPPPEACNADLSGLLLVTADEATQQVTVAGVVRESAGDVAGVRIADELLEIDGRPVAPLNLWDVRQALSVGNTTARLRLRRGADTFSVSILLPALP